jgi:hypothetical protein
LLPEDARPPLLGELVDRIDEALATARASEAAVMTVGAAALEAAEQARRAADLAARASETMAERSAEPRPAAGPFPAPTRVPLAPPRRPPIDTAPAEPPGKEEEEDPLSDFTARADRIAERLKRLERSPQTAADRRSGSADLDEVLDPDAGPGAGP